MRILWPISRTGRKRRSRRDRALARLQHGQVRYVMESDARAAVVGTEAITEHRGIRARYNARVAYLDPHASCSVSGLAHPMDPIHLLRRGSPFCSRYSALRDPHRRRHHQSSQTIAQTVQVPVILHLPNYARMLSP